MPSYPSISSVFPLSWIRCSLKKLDLCKSRLFVVGPKMWQSGSWVGRAFSPCILDATCVSLSFHSVSGFTLECRRRRLHLTISQILRHYPRGFKPMNSTIISISYPSKIPIYSGSWLHSDWTGFVFQLASKTLSSIIALNEGWILNGTKTGWSTSVTTVLIDTSNKMLALLPNVRSSSNQTHPVTHIITSPMVNCCLKWSDSPMSWKTMG